MMDETWDDEFERLKSDIKRKALRDQFAEAALTGLLADSKLDAKWGAFAVSAYEIADEMLAAREAG